MKSNVEHIYGQSATGKTLYALHKMYIKNKKTAVFSFDSPLLQIIPLVNELYDKNNKFSYYDCRFINTDNFIEHIVDVSKFFDQIIVDGFNHLAAPEESSFLYEGLDRKTLIDSLLNVNANIIVVEHGYSNILSSNEITSESKAENSLNIKIDSKLSKHLGNNRYLVGDVIFTYNPNTKTIVKWEYIEKEMTTVLNGLKSLGYTEDSQIYKDIKTLKGLE